jgi:hypothetical protein
MSLKQDIINDILLSKLFIDDRGNIYGPQYEPYLSYSTGLWQNPEEFASLIEWFADKKIRTFLNIGTFNGVSFKIISKYLKTYNPNAECISIDPIDHKPEKVDGLIYYDKTSFDYLRMPFDLVFIDGDHRYDSVKEDFNHVGKFAKYCVFHDIRDKYIGAMSCGGVVRFWEEIKFKYRHHEFVCGENKVMGIGLLEIRQ